MSNEAVDPDIAARRLARESLAGNDPTGWFERLYSAAEDGEAVVPWDRGTANILLADWTATACPDGTGERALVVGAGTGWDAELISTTATTPPPSTSRRLRSRQRGGRTPVPLCAIRPRICSTHPRSGAGPSTWWSRSTPCRRCRSSFRRPRPSRSRRRSPRAARCSSSPQPGRRAPATLRWRGPPWPLTRAAIDAFASDDLRLIQLDRQPSPADPTIFRWRAEYSATDPRSDRRRGDRPSS